MSTSELPNTSFPEKSGDESVICKSIFIRKLNNSGKANNLDEHHLKYSISMKVHKL